MLRHVTELNYHINNDLVKADRAFCQLKKRLLTKAYEKYIHVLEKEYVVKLDQKSGIYQSSLGKTANVIVSWNMALKYTH